MSDIMSQNEQSTLQEEQKTKSEKTLHNAVKFFP